jgi:predicted GNAT family acetyltransferase
MENQEYTVRNNEVNLQFEIELEGEIAYLTYRFYKKNIAFMHTFVPVKLAGKGLASALAIHAFAYAKTNKKLVMVYCPFVSKFIKKNTEYLAQVDQSYLGRS